MSEAHDITVRLRHQDDPSQRARLSLRLAPHPGERPAITTPIRAAILAGGGDDGIPPSHCQVLQAEIVAGMLTGLRGGSPAWAIELTRLAGEDAEGPTLSRLPSIAFAVAATLAVRHGTGREDLVAAPRGGYEWELVGIEATAAQS